MTTIVLKFPRPELTKLPPDEAPNARTVKKFINEASENLASIQTSLGGGENGHLGMIQTDAQYALEDLPSDGVFVPFVMPDNPGVLGCSL